MDVAPRFGVVERDALLEMDGLGMLREMIAGRLPRPPISEGLNFWLAEADEGTVRFEGSPSEDHLNPLGGVHGGWALTLIDSAAGCSLHSTLPAGVGYTTVETKANFTRPLRPGDSYVCEGRLLGAGSQIATAEAYLRSTDGKLVAHGTSTLIILRPR